MDASAVPHVFSLTEIIGRKAGRDRTQIVATFEVQRRYLWVGVIAAVPSVIAASLLAPLLGMYSIFVLVGAEAALVYLYEHRQSSGLELRTYQRVWDSHKDASGTVFVCGAPVDVDRAEIVVLTSGTRRVDV